MDVNGHGGTVQEQLHDREQLCTQIARALSSYVLVRSSRGDIYRVVRIRGT